MQDVIDSTIVFINSMNLVEASITVEKRIDQGTKYIFKLGDKFVRAEMAYDHVRIDSDNKSTEFIDDYAEAHNIFAIRIFRMMSEYIYHEHA